jgi:Rrf2 family cysteine metabolism transcriptional repressor
MKLGTKIRYGTRAMLELALNYDGGQGLVSANEIAVCQQISVKYLEQLLATLRTAGLVRSVRGTHGGHMLVSPPAQINLREIYDAFEGSQGFAECTASPEICSRSDVCATHQVWERMYAASMEVLESTTLEDLVRHSRDEL